MSKEKLEEIDRHNAIYSEFKAIGNKYVAQTVTLDMEDYRFIMQHAKEKIQLEERVKELEKLSLSLGSKNKRYKQALEEIAYKQYNVEPKRVVVKLRSKATQALQGGNENE
jgi:hypothetical protein